MTTTTDPREDALIALAELEEAREAFAEFREHWQAVGRAMRSLDNWRWHRVEAYPGWDGLRDVGAGQDLEGWMTEVEEALAEIRDGEPDGFVPSMHGDTEAEREYRAAYEAIDTDHDDEPNPCDGFVGANAWGPCTKCGMLLGGHDR